ncbi:MAG: Stf0 family sulfotransferase [Sphingopyxis sp.]
MATGQSAVERGYVLCGAARTGSTLLSRALRDTGVLGYPQEYFNPRAIALAHGERYPKSRTGQIAEIFRRGQSDNGVYALKLFADQFDALRGFDWAVGLPNLHFVTLERRDLLGQAMSWVRASQSQQWDSDQQILRVPRYDEAAIGRALEKFARARARWQIYFARNAIAPLILVYEDMVDTLPETIRAIAALVGVSGLPDDLPHCSQMQVQRDAVSEEWRSRFVASKHDLAIFDRLKTWRFRP